LLFRSNGQYFLAGSSLNMVFGRFMEKRESRVAFMEYQASCEFLGNRPYPPQSLSTIQLREGIRKPSQSAKVEILFKIYAQSASWISDN
jgi:hypothetical protein